MRRPPRERASARAPVWRIGRRRVHGRPNVTRIPHHKSVVQGRGHARRRDSGDAVMMEWETPLMAAHADVCVGAFPHDVCGHLKDRNDLRVLNVGHGLGIVDGFLRNYASRIAAHRVIEPHPDVLKRVDSQTDRWEGVTFRRETWRESLRDEAFGPFDAIFFDTYAERYEDMRQFLGRCRASSPRAECSRSSTASRRSTRSSTASPASSSSANSIPCGLDCAFVPLQSTSPRTTTRRHRVRRRYWRFDTYHLPLASHKTT